MAYGVLLDLMNVSIEEAYQGVTYSSVHPSWEQAKAAAVDLIEYRMERLQERLYIIQAAESLGDYEGRLREHEGDDEE